MSQLERAATKLDFGPNQAQAQIADLRKLTHEVSSKTERTADKLFQQYIRHARRRYAKSVARAQGGGSGSAAAEIVLLPLRISVSSAQGSGPVPVIAGKPLNRKAKSVTKSLLKLHNAVNSRSTIPKSQYKSVRDQVKQLAQGLRLGSEVELSKFDFLYNRRSDITR